MNNPLSPRISIAIPCYEMKGLGVSFLAHSIGKILRQSYKNIEIVVSDHSQDRQIENFLRGVRNYIPVKYFRNLKDRGSSSANLNNALRNCSGEITKILFQDDYLYHDRAIEEIVAAFTPETSWLITACEHSVDGFAHTRPFYPVYKPEIGIGQNTLSSPSTLSVRTSKLLRFDENLLWQMDCDYYKRLYDRYGLPAIVNEIGVVNRMWAGQVTSSIVTREKVMREDACMMRRYGDSVLM